MNENYVSVTAALHDAVAPLVRSDQREKLIDQISVALYLDRDTLNVLREIVQRADMVGGK